MIKVPSLLELYEVFRDELRPVVCDDDVWYSIPCKVCFELFGHRSAGQVMNAIDFPKV